MIARPLTLIEAARAGNLHAVQQLLAKKETNINEQDDNGTTALMAAADCNHVNMVKALLIWGSDINMADGSRMTALMIAAEKGYSGIVYELVVMKAAIQIENIQALGLAVKAGHLNVVRMLLAHGASPISLIESHTAPEYVAVNNNLPMARELLVYRANFNTGYAIQKAVDHGHVDMVLLFASHEEDAGIALNIAVKAGNAEMVGALLFTHVKIDVQIDLGYSALMLASELGHLNVVNLILAHPEAAKTINQVDNSKQTALMYAARMKHLEIVRVLLAAGADVNLQDANGFTALLYAIDARMIPSSVELVRELLIWKANTLINNVGNASVDFANLPEKTDILRYIKEHIKEQKNYDELKKEMESFFAGKIKLSETPATLFFPTPLVRIIGEYTSPTIMLDVPKNKSFK